MFFRAVAVTATLGDGEDPRFFVRGERVGWSCPDVKERVHIPVGGKKILFGMLETRSVRRERLLIQCLPGGGRRGVLSTRLLGFETTAVSTRCQAISNVAKVEIVFVSTVS